MNTHRWIDRRHFLYGAGLSAAAATCTNRLAHAATGPTVLHHPATASNVIFLFMSGGPSQVDTFDPKPELDRLEGEDVPESIAASIPRIKRAGIKNLMRSPWKFKNHGESGIPVSELFPNVAKQVDDLCVIRSMQHNNPVHGPGECVALTGTSAGDRPSIGSWSLYGLGTANENLPAFITMNLHSDGMQYPQGAGWGSGFLPSGFQGTIVDPSKGIRHVAMPPNTTEQDRRQQLDLIHWFNDRHLRQSGEQSELQARIDSYETAFRMQTAAPDLFDISKETQQTHQLYELDNPQSKSVGKACLLARRMVERGVRFVQVRVGGWDAHGNIQANHSKMASRTDGPIASLLTDLRQRDLLKSTLVVWAGEFGRTPTKEGRGKGRDHSPAGYTTWLAGGGIQGGQIIGATDPLGYVAIERPVSPHDFHATILHALGIDANRLTYNHHGRDEVPTVFGGEAVKEAFA
ncbi:hypothetical protein FF011L_47030 [Roseimaritima multifibrata]|uniref:Sulfatase n=1 Tax=Roseimaritima multifibrata TaxID=1930274 RepID=A0A517MLY9_9BACT|nr:DUF1501 domain-containing protein [Roseimaritima multifibrata]QDS95902.1 hypothetical protein FF011L_47030 [Roseimaritima multifibrata]